MGFDPIGVKAAIEMCGIDPVVFGTDFGPIPFGVRNTSIVEAVIPDTKIARKSFRKPAIPISTLWAPV